MPVSPAHPPQLPTSSLDSAVVSDAPNALSTINTRDAMMAYAYSLYDSPGPGITHLGLTSVPLLTVQPPSESTDDIYRKRLLPLLLTLLEYHPQHLPILLLLACTYHALGDYKASLDISHQILSVCPTYVEAMSNIGTTFKALGQTEKAYEWWWKALQICPTYWDALDNILGMTFTLAHHSNDQARRLTYYLQAQSACRFVQRQVLDNDDILSRHLRPCEVPRLQRAIFTNGTIYTTLGPTNAERAILEYARALELVIRPPPPTPEAERYSLRDLLLTTCVAGYAMSPDATTTGTPDISGILRIDVRQQLRDPNFNLLYAVRASGDPLLHAFLRIGGGILPTLLLTPEQVTRLQSILCPHTKGVLTAICTPVATGEYKPPNDKVRQQTSTMTSTILLTLAKRIQDNTLHSVAIPGSGGGLRTSTSVVVLLYYLALTWTPAPSTYNNLGIVLSGVSDSRKGADGEMIDGASLARQFYTAGLRLDPKHPHLLTNLGSLMKDQGQTEQAIELYTKAVEQMPEFDIALANLGNAIKDAGRPWDAVEYYRRAIAVNANLPEAICGLANSLSSICDWDGRGAMPHEIGVDDAGRFIPPGPHGHEGWVTRMAEVTDEQLSRGGAQGLDADALPDAVQQCLLALAAAAGRPLRHCELATWNARFQALAGGAEGGANNSNSNCNSVGFLIRFVDWIIPRLQRRWYVQEYGMTVVSEKTLAPPHESSGRAFLRPMLPKTMQAPPVPSVLPFHTFTYPLSPRITRLIPNRSALRISYTAFCQPWLPKHVYRPPSPPPGGKINIGYISNDVNNHPLSHLMQSVFGMHDRSRFTVFIYTTSPWDGSAYRPRIASTVEQCIDASQWSLHAIVSHIMEQNIHILINLGGYTKGSRNDIFAARPCPVQMQLMGYAGTLGAGWCDYLICDPIACPQELSASERWRKTRAAASGGVGSPMDLDADIDPEGDSDEWIYMEKFLYMPHTFMVTDHKQSFRGDDSMSPEERARVPPQTLWLQEERRRADARKQVFPDLPQDVVVFANFNQLYKIDPGIFFVWLRILRRVPRSVLWLLRFPAAGEAHLLRSAKLWAGEEVASRIRFTEVVKKDWHIFRGRVADLFLDTAECNAHTIAADVLWTGTPVLTWPKHGHKMCSRVAASMAHATGFGRAMVVHSAEEYEARAVALACSPSPSFSEGGTSELLALRRDLFVNRDRMPLFDTLRWTRNLEKGLAEAWRRWVAGTQYECSDEWEACAGPERESGCIWVQDDDPVHVAPVE